MDISHNMCSQCIFGDSCTRSDILRTSLNNECDFCSPIDDDIESKMEEWKYDYRREWFEYIEEFERKPRARNRLPLSEA